MKRAIYILALLLVILTGCSKQQKDYPNIKYSKIIKDVKWGSGVNEIKALLEDKYKLDFNKELKQSRQNSRVLEFTGGKIEGIGTQRWGVCFTDNCLTFIMIKIESGSANEIERIFLTLKNGVDKVSFTKMSAGENEWIFSENKDAKCTLQLAKCKNGITMLFSSSKFIKSSQK
ncbi:MAG: hypothetical protein ACM3S2_14675 [Ignavibacteriales bacterium]